MHSEVVELYKEVLKSDHPWAEKEMMLNEVRKLQPAGQNRWNFRWIALAVALVAISGPAAFLFGIYNSQEKDLPPEVISLSSTAIGALAAYLTSAAKSD